MIPKNPKRKKLFLHGGKTWWDAEVGFIEHLRSIIENHPITSIITPGKTEKKTLMMKKHFPDIHIRSGYETATMNYDAVWSSTLLYLPWCNSNIDLYHKILTSPHLLKALYRSEYLFWSSAGMMILGAWFRSGEITAKRHPWFNFFPYIAEPHLHERDRVDLIKEYSVAHPAYTIIWVDEQTMIEINRKEWIGDTHGPGTSIVYEASKQEEKQRHIYILRCADDSLYTWITTDLSRRLIEHNTSPLGASYTKNKRPVTCVWTQTARDRSEASKIEGRIKKCSKIEKEHLVASQRLFKLD